MNTVEAHPSSPSFVRESLVRISSSLKSIRAKHASSDFARKPSTCSVLVWEDDTFTFADGGPNGPFNDHNDK